MMHGRMGHEYSIIKIALKKEKREQGRLMPSRYPSPAGMPGFPAQSDDKKTTDYSPEVIEAAKRVGQLPRPEGVELVRCKQAGLTRGHKE